MKHIIVSAKYKGSTEGKFKHGESYFLKVSHASGSVEVQELRQKEGEEYKHKGEPVNYDSVVSFLFNWEEITSYPTVG